MNIQSNSHSLDFSEIDKPIPRDANTDGRLIYAIGDIHGCYSQLKSLLKIVTNDATQRANGRTPLLIFCGDYIDRGPHSSQVIDSLCWLKRHRPFDLHFLKGNHEAILLRYLYNPSDSLSWIRFGGRETLSSYGVRPPDVNAPLIDHVRARDDLMTQLPVSHLLFLENLELSVTIGDYTFVHAGIKPGVPLDKQVESDVLWIREEFLNYNSQHEKIIVHGHTWFDEYPVIEPNRIGIDTGTYETGVLSALRLEDGEIEVLHAR
ncbi:metallophosphoesterase family protein [Novosphingobium terrae]|uniref:metallophosphoesterase family protein n=1 Tax=Novosphingobium terrae TaxID=2726189 RepID=UPI00197E37B6|nr:metallophosphoesterase family protein [Novosphingobium terrae]